VAMTGEVTLQGQVLPIGGLKLKILAAHRAGLKKVIFPKLNEIDLDDVPEEVLKDLELIPVEDILEVLKHALVPAPEQPVAVEEPSEAMPPSSPAREINVVVEEPPAEEEEEPEPPEIEF
ncbi:MAG TPA: hypothetical protein P5195_04405, partial [Anaerolineae bacterium]|nr:hypothetical protein [Anaerolineae bacterium]